VFDIWGSADDRPAKALNQMFSTWGKQHRLKKLVHTNLNKNASGSIKHFL
jgi:hypothetical protein